MKEYKDQMNQTIRLSGIPGRIVSLVPSQTELLYSLGLGDRVVGITRFCIHPEEWFRTKKRIGGTKNADPEKIKQLLPDLIIGNKEENQKENIAELKEIAPVWMSDIFNLEDAFDMMRRIGEIVGKPEKAEGLIASVDEKFRALKAAYEEKTEPSSVLYLIWRKPFIAAGNNTFIDDMLSKCGFVNCMREERYPELNLTAIQVPDFVFLSSEPYPFKEKHMEEIQQIYPASKIVLVDGEMFSWYGSRLLEAPDYFMRLKKELMDAGNVER